MLYLSVIDAQETLVLPEMRLPLTHLNMCPFLNSCNEILKQIASSRKEVCFGSWCWRYKVKALSLLVAFVLAESWGGGVPVCAHISALRPSDPVG